MKNHKDYESPVYNSDNCINYFIFIFQCILVYYYFRFIRLLNASNCSIITFSFIDFIHELFSCYRVPVDMNTWRAAIGFFLGMLSSVCRLFI